MTAIIVAAFLTGGGLVHLAHRGSHRRLSEALEWAHKNIDRYEYLDDLVPTLIDRLYRWRDNYYARLTGPRDLP